MVDHPLRAPRAAGFLVGNCEVDQGALGSKPALREVAKRDRLGGGLVEHVERATTPDFTVDQLATEWVAAPSVAVHRHHVGVSHQTHRRCGRVGAFHASDQGRAARARLVRGQLDAGSFEVGAKQIDIAHLATGIRRPVVDAFGANQSLQQLRGSPGEVGRHTANVADPVSCGRGSAVARR